MPCRHWLPLLIRGQNRVVSGRRGNNPASVHPVLRLRTGKLMRVYAYKFIISCRSEMVSTNADTSRRGCIDASSGCASSTRTGVNASAVPNGNTRSNSSWHEKQNKTREPTRSAGSRNWNITQFSSISPAYAETAPTGIGRRRSLSSKLEYGEDRFGLRSTAPP